MRREEQKGYQTEDGGKHPETPSPSTLNDADPAGKETVMPEFFEARHRCWAVNEAGVQ
jgi:hypothetical protein